MSTPRRDPPAEDTAQRRKPDEAGPGRSSAQRDDEDESLIAQLGEDPGTLEPDRD